MKIPTNIIRDVESEASGFSHGVITLQLSIRDFRLCHYKINREKSVTLTLAEGSPPNSLQGNELEKCKPKNENRV